MSLIKFPLPVLWKQSLMARLVGSFLVLSLAMVILVGFIAYRQATEALKASVFERLNTVATFKTGELNRWVDARMKDVTFLSGLSELRTPTESLMSRERSDPVYWTVYNELSEFLGSVQADRPDSQEIFILSDAGGRIILSTDPAKEGRYRTKDLYFILGRQGTFVQGVYASPMTLKPTLTITAPIFGASGKKRLGVLAVHMDLNHMDQIIGDSSGLGRSGESYLVDSLNVFVSADRFGRLEFPRGVHTEGIDTALLGRNGSGLYENYEGVPVIGVYRWLEERQLALMVEMSREEAFAPARKLARTIILVGFASACLLALGVYALARQIVRPIKTIADTAMQVAEGDLDSVVPVPTEDEVGLLARSFNLMVGQLNRLYKGLEDKVAELKRAQETLRESEIRYRTLFDRVPMGLYRSTSQGTYLDVNPAFVQMLAYPDRKTLLLTSTRDLYLDPAVQKKWMALTEEKGLVRNFEVQLRRRDGSTFWVSNTARSVRDEEGQLLYYEGCLDDITARKKAEGELKKYREHLEERVAERTVDLKRINAKLQHEISVRRGAEDEILKLNEGLEQRVQERTSELSVANRLLLVSKESAEAASRAKGRFLANMSHELRTPLNIILGFSHLMNRDSQITPDQRESLKSITRSGEHLLALINDILEMSKIEAGRTALKKQDFDLRRTLSAIERMVRNRTDAKGLRLTVDTSPDLPRYIRTDEGKLRQVLINLLGNAVKFTDEGGVTLRTGLVDHGPENGGGPSLFFEIRDTGVGIEKSETGIIFDAFSQTGAGNRAREGTGLGLTISKQYVQLMGGDISAENLEGKGSLFRFDIRFEPAEPAKIKPENPARRVIRLERSRQKWRILIVENNRESRELLGKLLKSVGFDVREARDGRDGIRVFEQWRPHLIWMDLRMPVMDGLEAAGRIKASPGGKSTRIIALTAGSFEEQKARALSSGCDDFISKPFGETEIFSTMERHLGVRYIHEEETKSPDAAVSVEKRTERSGEMDLGMLPENLLNELFDATTACEVETISSIIERVGRINGPLADSLSDMAKRFRYDEILSLIGERQ